jgi:subtilisin family serine protease
MKRILILFAALTVATFTFAQKKKAVEPDNWYHMDPKTDKVYGVAADLAYKTILPTLTPKTVVVAVIDGGTDITHEDLKEVLWVNPREIEGNGIDDDKNGYVDDINGWDFIGGKDGTPVDHDTYELTRLYVKMKPKYDAILSDSGLSAADKKEYALYAKVKDDFESKLNQSKSIFDYYSSTDRGLNSILNKLKTEDLTIDDVMPVPVTSQGEIQAKKLLVGFVKSGQKVAALRTALTGAKDHYFKETEYYLNVKFNPRTIVGDNYEAAQQRNYGNNLVKGPSSDHGTHVAGIIGANRSNTLGMMGIAGNAKIMVLRVVPDGDERDKDVANAIRYAADNGASVINMSFGKNYTYNKKAVDEAVQYAMSKDVLMVHAAGNNSENNDVISHYPTVQFEDTTITPTGWIEVGASSWKKGKNLAAEFSNYGFKSVDVFAPGVNIYATLPESTYGKNSGTSMAAPVTAGVAALIRSYYPDLTAQQVKEIIMESVTKVKGKVYIPGGDENGKKKKVPFKTLCASGGIVNAYKALQLAATTPGLKKSK